MKKKMVWLLVSCLMVAALLLASCGPAAEEEDVVTPGEEEEVVPVEEEEVVTEEKEMVSVTFTKLDGTVIEKSLEKPEYGGVFVRAMSSDVQGFDEAYTGWGQAVCSTLHITNEELLTGDYTKGGAGTSEASWLANEFFDRLSVGCLAESWEIPDDETVIYHIRQGIHWHDKPPVNGRELTADDVVFSVNRLFATPGSYAYGVYEPDVRDAISITAPDKWTVVQKWLPGYCMESLRILAEYTTIMAPEVVEEYGDMKDWRNSIGTGPFMLVDYVNMSTATFDRNPNYWRKHPIFGDQMPYVDGVKWLIIPDASTRLSALRTGKLDIHGVSWEDIEALTETNPELVMAKNPPTLSNLIFMRTDKPELPFSDQRVRQALQLGLDNEAIVDAYYGGNALLVVHPIAPLLEFEKDMYIPLEELPEVVQELYGYNPEKAKQLLAEAGYPDGFTTEIICTAGYSDILSIVKADWEKIGVILNLEVRDSAVYNSIGYRRNHKEMIVSTGVDSTPRTWNNFAPDNLGNKSMIDDPRVNEAIEYWLVHSMEWDNITQVAREIYPYILEQAWTVPLPTQYSFVFWWPWIKGYYGESSYGFYNHYNYINYLWIDQDLKKEMGY